MYYIFNNDIFRKLFNNKQLDQDLGGNHGWRFTAGAKYLMKLPWLCWRRNYGNVGKCTSAWIPGWLVIRVFLSLRMMFFRKEKVFWIAGRILIGGFKKFPAQIRSQISNWLNLKANYFWAKFFSSCHFWRFLANTRLSQNFLFFQNLNF